MNEDNPNNSPRPLAPQPEDIPAPSPAAVGQQAVNPVSAPVQPQDVFQNSIPDSSPAVPVSKKNKLIFIVVGLFITALTAGGVAWGLLANSGIADNDVPYNSPVGLLPPFQEGNIRQADYSVNFPISNQKPISVSGKVLVADDGSMHFETLDHPEIQNNLLEFLLSKNTDEPFNEADWGASKYFSYDFKSLLNYNYLEDKQRLFFGNFIDIAEQAEVSQNLQEESPLYAQSPQCGDHISSVKGAIGNENLNTEALGFEILKSGEKYVATMDVAVLQEVDAKVINFFENCFDFGNPSIVEYGSFIDGLKENEREPLDISYFQNDDDSWTMRIDSDLSNSIEFTVSNFSESPAEIEGLTRSVTSRSNLYALTHQACRVAPVVTSDFAAAFSYTFSVENTFYTYPSEFDSNYICSTVDTGHNPGLFSITINDPEHGEISISSNGREGKELFAAVNDLRFFVEEFYVENERYPSHAEYEALLSKLGSLESYVATLISDDLLSYEPLPSGCTHSDCNDFLLAHTVQNVTLNMYSYERKINDLK